MVRRDEKPSFLAASCWMVLVVNGAPGRLFRRRCSTLVTTNGRARTASTTARASASLWSWGLWPSTLTSEASKVCPLPSHSASMVQYSCDLKARISRSRSTIRRSATVCTRPAESPVLMVRQRIGLAL